MSRGTSPSASCSTHRRATSGRSWLSTTRTCATRATDCCRYIRRKSLYHYVIDRFGRVFRIVEEGSKANHAGNSIWANGDTVYLNLNHSFLGVCFETRWDGGLALPITQAQFGAGRNLTEHLRQRYDIPAEMGVTHGITSVNPRSHLIGHHLDWAARLPLRRLRPAGCLQRARTVGGSVRLLVR